MGTSEHERQAAVGYFARSHQCIGKLVGDQLNVGLCLLPNLLSSRGVDLTPARDSQKPGIGVIGYAPTRPVAQRGGEGVGHSVLGPGHVTRAGSQKGDKPSIALAGGRLGHPVPPPPAAHELSDAIRRQGLRWA